MRSALTLMVYYLPFKKRLLYCGIVGGRIGGWGIEGMADRVVRNGIRDSLGGSVAFKFMACPFLYTVKVYLVF